MTDDPTPADSGWTREALDRLRAALKAERLTDQQRETAREAKKGWRDELDR